MILEVCPRCRYTFAGKPGLCPTCAKTVREETSEAFAQTAREFQQLAAEYHEQVERDEQLWKMRGGPAPKQRKQAESLPLFDDHDRPRLPF